MINSKQNRIRRKRCRTGNKTTTIIIQTKKIIKRPLNKRRPNHSTNRCPLAKQAHVERSIQPIEPIEGTQYFCFSRSPYPVFTVSLYVSRLRVTESFVCESARLAYLSIEPHLVPQVGSEHHCNETPITTNYQTVFEGTVTYNNLSVELLIE